MKIIRYEDAGGTVRYAVEQPGGSYFRIDGNLFGKFEVTREKADVRKILAPVVPRCSGASGKIIGSMRKKLAWLRPNFP